MGPYQGDEVYFDFTKGSLAWPTRHMADIIVRYYEINYHCAVIQVFVDENSLGL